MCSAPWLKLAWMPVTCTPSTVRAAGTTWTKPWPCSVVPLYGVSRLISPTGVKRAVRACLGFWASSVLLYRLLSDLWCVTQARWNLRCACESQAPARPGPVHGAESRVQLSRLDSRYRQPRLPRRNSETTRLCLLRTILATYPSASDSRACGT